MEIGPSFRKGECIDAKRRYPEGERVGPTGGSGCEHSRSNNFWILACRKPETMAELWERCELVIRAEACKVRRRRERGIQDENDLQRISD
jgi:hypothetical protein